MNARDLRLLIGLFISLSIDLAGRSACAQPAGEPLGAGPANFGLQDAVVDEIGWEEILPTSSTVHYYGLSVGSSTGYVFYRFSLEQFESFVSLGQIPHGARLLGFNIYYFDSGANDNLKVEYCRDYVDSATGVPLRSECLATFLSTGEPGAAVANLLIPAAFQTILRRDDIGADGSYEAVHHYLRINLGPDVGVHSIRPQWLRQVSLAPAVATFNDVPTSDGAFQFIQAMAASGITAGCGTGPPRYCPDSFVTRRQMAVFFAKALGLHWSPF